MPRSADVTLQRLAHDPRRSPRWRYERLRELLDSPRRTRPGWTRDDRAICKAYTFLRKWDDLGRQYRNPRMLQEYRQQTYADNPELYLAHDMAFAADGDRTRFEVEARILARQTDEEIAEEVGGLPGMVHWYEQLFFNVRDRLKNRGYIVNRIICPAVLEPSWEQLTLDMSSKFFGYFAGPAVLDTILYNYDCSTLTPQRGDDTTEFFEKHWSTQFRRRAAEAVNVFEFNKYNVVELFEIHARLLDSAQKAKNNVGELSTIEQNVEAMLSSINWVAGSRRETALADSPLKPYIGQAGEMRASELMQVISGEVPETLTSLADFKLPERSQKKNEQSVE